MLTDTPQLYDISQLDYASALGIGHDLNTHTKILDVIQCFHGVRKEVERQKSMLSSATVAQIKKRQTLLPENVAKSIQEDKYRRLLLPLIIKQPTVESLNNYIIACLVITEHRVDRLERCGLLDIFHQLFTSVIGTISAQPTTIDFIDTMIIEKLKQIETPSSETPSSEDILSRQLQEIFKSTRNERPAKRPCLNRRASTTPESTQNTNTGQDEILVLGPELLQDISDEVDPSQPPPVDGPRHVVMQLTGAMINRLEALLGPDSPLLQAIKSSLQWRWERAREESLRTDCIIAMIPASEMQDFSIVIKVGYAAGRKISDYLRYGSSITMTTTLPQ